MNICMWVHIIQVRMKLSKFQKSERLKPMLLSASSVMLIFSLLSVSVLAVISTQSKGNSAFAQTSILRTTELKVNFKKLVEAGSDQNIRIKVTDVGSGDPVSSALVRITIYFPGGAPIRQFSLLTGKDGQASLTLPIDKNAALGQYGIDVLVSALGYFDSAVGTIAFAVNSQVDQNVDLHDYKHTSHTLSDHSGHHKPPPQLATVTTKNLVQITCRSCDSCARTKGSDGGQDTEASCMHAEFLLFCSFKNTTVCTSARGRSALFTSTYTY